MKQIKIVTAAIILLFGTSSNASLLLGYEFGEMASNEFKNFAGEIGYTFTTGKAIRMVYMNVALTEKHLSSSSTLAVDGDNVAGKWKGIEFFFDMPLTKNVMVSPSAGYYDSQYWHTILNESIQNKSPTAGIALSYLGDNVFGADSLYWRLSGTFRYYFESSETTKLGDTVIGDDVLEFIPWIFVGYRFD